MTAGNSPWWLRRVAGVLLILVGAVGVALSAAGILGCWTELSSLAERTARVSERVENLLGVTADSLDRVRASLGKARADLDALGEAEGAPQGPRKPRLGRAASRKLASQLTGSLGDTQRTLSTVVEGAVVVNSLLEGLDEVPLVHMTTLDTSRLEGARDRVTVLTGQARKLQSLLDGPGSGGGEVAKETSQMRQTLAEAAPALERLSARVVGSQRRVAELRSGLPRWLLVTQIALTVLLVWVGTGQVSLMAHGWSWCRKA